MSTKIYKAYAFDKKYTLCEINQMMIAVRKEMAEMVRRARGRYIVQELVHMYDFLHYFGKEKVNEQHQRYADIVKEKRSKYSDVWMSGAWRMLDCAPEHWTEIRDYLSGYFNEKAHEDSQSKSIMNNEFDYNSEVTLIPTENKILLMYHGNSDLQAVVNKLPYLSDYHYQNQTDRPDDVSDEAWAQRAKDWEEAIGPDYIPAKHGLIVQLFNCTYDIIGLELSDLSRDDIPSLESRTRWLMDYMDDYPNPPASNATYLAWVKYWRSPVYLEWKEKRLAEIQEKLPTISV